MRSPKVAAITVAATATPGTVHAGGRPIEVTWLTITDLGRQALAGM